MSCVLFVEVWLGCRAAGAVWTGRSMSLPTRDVQDSKDTFMIGCGPSRHFTSLHVTKHVVSCDVNSTLLPSIWTLKLQKAGGALLIFDISLAFQVEVKSVTTKISQRLEIKNKDRKACEKKSKRKVEEEGDVKGQLWQSNMREK